MIHHCQPKPSRIEGQHDYPFDTRLSERVGTAMAEFEHSLAAAITQPAPDALDELRESTDQLMRAAARALMELERHRDDTSGGEAAD